MPLNFTPGEVSAQEVLRSALEVYGLGDLTEWYWGKVNGTQSQDEIYLELIQQDAYKDRFRAMETLRKQGKAISENEYVQYERQMAGLESRYGLAPGLLTDRDQVAKQLTAQVSYQEMEERARISQAAAYQSTPEVKQALQDMYGVGLGGLTSYFLDPDRALPLVEKQYVAAQIAGEALTQGLSGPGRAQAERYVEQGVTVERARTAFGQVASTAGLGYGPGESIDEAGRTEAAFGSAPDALRQRRVQASRVGQYQGGGAFAAGEAGVTGLG